MNQGFTFIFSLLPVFFYLLLVFQLGISCVNYVLFFVQLTSFISFVNYEAGFYKPTIQKVHPPICMITAHTTMSGCLFIFLSNYDSTCFDPNEWYNLIYAVAGFEPMTLRTP